MPSTLSSTLRDMRATALVRQAETIQDYPTGPERIAEAETYIREAMLQRSLGAITHEEEHRIFSLLHFAMPEYGSPDGERAPIDPREAPAADAVENTSPGATASSAVQPAMKVGIW